MRYWAYFAAKLVAAGAVLWGLLASLSWLWPPAPQLFTYVPPRFGYDLGFTLAVLVWFLLCSGSLYIIVWDQRYRCRTCLRRLRMPVETGSWSRMLQLGLPRIEYICPYGHGTLKEDEWQISGLTNAEWTPHSDDLWEELCAASKDPTEES
ncbi:MAG TPA: hypothetical protein VMH81_11795 [Bryobacteraceae bacterium]|nr:hypothetical protein [Bryobacteraceae bacterium]